MNEDQEELILKHYLTINRYGDKGIVPEVVDPNSPTAKLLRRIEQKRLGADCTKAIDMRGKVPGMVEQHKHQGITHFLDKKSKKIFTETCEKHGGRFTVEAFEKVTGGDHTHKARQKKETKAMLEKQREAQQQAAKKPSGNKREESEQSSDIDVVARGSIHFSQMVQFGNVCIREEPRMTYSTKVFMLRQGGEPLFARTIDISTGGVQISTDDLDEEFKKGEELMVHFDALEKEFKEKVLKSKYTIIDIQLTDSKMYLKLARIPSNDDRSFVSFFDSFIEKNKRRYKTDCQDLVDRIGSRVYEHSYCLNMTSMPLLVAKQDKDISVLAGISNSENKSFVHELSTNLTAHSVSAEHLARFAINARRKHMLSEKTWQITVFSFISVKEKELFLASSSDFEEEHEMNMFIRLGLANNKFRAYHCLVSELDNASKEKAYTILRSIPGYSNLNFKSAKAFVDDATHTVMIHDVTTSIAAINVPDEAFNQSNAEGNFSSFKAKVKEHRDIEILDVAFRRNRSELRYLHETDATVNAKGKTLNGMTRDFSIKGLCIDLDAPCLLSIGTEVEVTLPTFAKITKDKRLRKMEYELVRLNDKKTVLHLARKSEKHSGSEFFKALIDKNKEKLTVCNREDVQAFKTKISEILTVDNILSLPFFIGRGEKVAFELKTVGYSNQMRHVDEAFKVADEEWDIPFLLDNNQLRLMLKDQKRAQDVGKAYSTDVYILKDADGAMICKLARELAEQDKLKAFLNRCRKSEMFRCYHVVINKALKLNKLDFEEDMSQVRVRSLAKHKLLTEQMDNIHMVGDAFDITGSLPHLF